MVTLEVTAGPLRQDFHIRGNYLTETGMWFCHYLHQLAVDEAALIVKLKQLPATIDIYVSNKCNKVTPRICAAPLGRKTKTDQDFVFEPLATCYVFGKAIEDNVLCNSLQNYFCMVIDHGDRTKVFLPGTHAVNVICRGTPQASPIRRFLANVYVELDNPDMLCEWGPPPCSDFLFDLSRVFFPSPWRG